MGVDILTQTQREKTMKKLISMYRKAVYTLFHTRNCPTCKTRQPDGLFYQGECVWCASERLDELNGVAM
jgi:hypothetical protein